MGLETIFTPFWDWSALRTRLKSEAEKTAVVSRVNSRALRRVVSWPSVLARLAVLPLVAPLDTPTTLYSELGVYVRAGRTLPSALDAFNRIVADAIETREDEESVALREWVARTQTAAQADLPRG